MSSWLETWGEDVPDTGSGDIGGMCRGGMEDMPGMMSSDEMDELESASGSAFDEMFLSMMMSTTRARSRCRRPSSPTARTPMPSHLAETIEETQTPEIETMKELLGSR